MNQYITGTVIKELRERKHMTQADLQKNSVFPTKQFQNEKQQKAIRKEMQKQDSK